MSSEPAQIFNHDLLMNVGDADRARLLYPRAADVLNWPALKPVFKSHEDIASRQKSRARKRGVWALAAGLAALWLAALEPRLGSHDRIWIGWTLAAVVVGLGLLGWSLGSQVLRGRTKLAWLHHRCATERLRQLHFQFLVRRLVPLAASDAQTLAVLMRERDTLLAKLKHDLEEGVAPQVAAIAGDLRSEQCWLVEQIEPGMATPHSVKLNEYLRAYGELRFKHQDDFATKKLEEGHGYWPRPPAGQAQRLRDVGTIFVIVVAAADILALVIALLGSPADEWLIGWFQTLAIMSALGVLALRVLEDGLRPQAEADRYESYRGEVVALSRKFEIAHDLPARIAIMERLEELSYRELREFIILHNRASFIL